VYIPAVSNEGYDLRALHLVLEYQDAGYRHAGPTKAGVTMHGDLQSQPPNILNINYNAEPRTSNVTLIDHTKLTFPPRLISAAPM
jgi:hypothetical protein